MPKFHFLEGGKQKSICYNLGVVWNVPLIFPSKSNKIK